jgi:predicted ATPase with chaperone activity
MSDQSATIPQVRPAKTTNPLPGVFSPPPVNKVEDTGLGILWLQDLALKIIYFQGFLTGLKIAEALAMPFAGIVDQILEGLKRDKMIEVRSSQMGLGESAYLYAITGAGIIRAREALDRCQYAGPAPVPLDVYNDAIRHQSRERVQVNNRNMRQVLGDLTFGESTFQKLGPAVNSGTSIFIYGAPGNGKTSVARSIGNLILSQTMYIPYSLFCDGQVITLFDSTNHKLAPEDDSTAQTNRGGMRKDARWVKICRPFIMVGGELTLAGLDLVFNDTLKYYEAPIQVKANGGILLIDDFGRQQVRPRDLLNRWIVPLENRIDYMSLHTGRKIEVPFDVLVMFSTNLPPRDLVDEAFLRRLRHKIEIVDPSYEEYRDIFKKVATAKGINYSDDALAYLLQEWYIKPSRKLRASHPRDLCDQILDIAHYLAVEPVMSKEMIDKAAESYFVEL